MRSWHQNEQVVNQTMNSTPPSPKYPEGIGMLRVLQMALGLWLPLLLACLGTPGPVSLESKCESIKELYKICVF